MCVLSVCPSVRPSIRQSVAYEVIILGPRVYMYKNAQWKEKQTNKQKIFVNAVFVGVFCVQKHFFYIGQFLKSCDHVFPFPVKILNATLIQIFTLKEMC